MSTSTLKSFQSLAVASASMSSTNQQWSGNVWVPKQFKLDCCQSISWTRKLCICGKDAEYEFYRGTGASAVVRVDFHTLEHRNAQLFVEEHHFDFFPPPQYRRTGL